MKVIKKNNIRYVSCIFIVLFLASFVFGDSQYGSNTSNVDIPDTGDWVYSSISISGAPADAVVTGIDVHFSCIHTWSGDLNIDLNDQDISRNYDLWENEGGNADNPSRTVYGISTFNGLPVNQTWYLFAQDTTGGDTGYIDEWWITIYYESKSYAVYSKIDSLSYGTDADGDGYYETFNFYIGVDADVTPGSADIYAKIICNTTGQAWWSTNPWTITGTETDYHYFYMDETYFSGYISGNTDLDFTVEIWDSTKSDLLATDTSVYGEPVQADYYIPPTYAVYSNIYNLVYGQDADGDGYYETYDFYIAIDADVSSGSSSIYARMICNTTGQAWWSADPWTITGTETDYHYFPLDETYFSGISGNTDLDFTVEIWDLSKSTVLATDTTVTGEPVKADYVDLTQTRFVGNDFVDKTAKIGIPILLKARLQYYSWLIWWDFSDQTVHFDIYHSGSWHEIPDDGISETSFVTDANGYASVYYTPTKTLSPGDYLIRARYDGSGTYAPYELTRTLTIKKPNWLVMIYICGDNNLDYEYSRIFYEDIAVSGNNDEVSIVLFFDRSDSPTYEPTWTTGRYYKVCKDNVVIHNDWGEVNMGSTATFNQFIELATLECSAYNRTILFKNHGSGVVQKPIEQEVSPIKPGIKDLFQDKAPPELINIQKINFEEEGSIQGVIFDDDPSDHLTLSEVRSVIGSYGNFGLIGYDACLMGMVEVVYDLKDYANYVVATEESNYTTSWKFQDMFSVMYLNNSTTAEQFADNIVQLSVQPTNGSWYLSTTNTTNINTEISSFADRMIELLPFSQSIRDNILNAWIASRSFYSSNYIDLRQFVLDIASSTTDSTLQLRANTVANRLANSTWRTSWKTTYEDTLGGLSIFFPPFKGGTKWDSYFSPDWCLFTSNSDQHWDEFLQLYFDDDNPDCYITVPNSGGWFKGDIAVSASASDSTSEILYVEFQYSVNGSNWYPLPGPDSPDGKDWYSPNGFALTFRTTSTPSHGTINDGTVWVRARSMDKAGNLSNWDVCDYAIGIDNSPPDLSGSFANAADPLPGNYSTLQSIVDSLSGVLDNTIYPRFYFRWNNNTIDSTNYDIVAVGSWNGSYYEANIDVSEENIGDRIFWRVLGLDNVDNSNWSPVHDGGVIQSINFVTDTDSISVPENGTATFQVKLSRVPASTVNAFVAYVSGDADITVQSGANLTFTTSNWNTYQTVTLAAAEDGDMVNGSTNFRITALGIPDKPITAVESDNDTVNFETNTNSVTVPEGSTATFQVRLTDQPASTVNASVSWVSGDSDITVQSGSSLTFTTSNWNTYQTVTLAALEDVDIVNGSTTIRMSAPGIPDKDITANEQDNDSLSFVTNTDSVTVAEGSTATFQVKLSHQPASNVSVFVTNVGGDSDITVQSGSNLTFTTSNWNIYQTVTLAALEDGDISNGSATIRISASGVPDKDITVAEQDNDTINFVTDTDSVIVPEGGTGTFQVKLSAQPSSEVYASVDWFSGDSDIAVQSGSSLTFTPSDWNIYQSVTVSASEDADIADDSAIIRLSASGVTDKDITVIEQDNDTLSFETDTDTITVPEGSTATFQVRLSHQPSSNVNASVSWVGGDSDITVQSGASLTFTSSNWNTYQTVTLAAAEDADETNDQATIRISAAGVPDKDITATEQDNDAEGISGRVTDSQGNGIQNVWVYVYDLDGYYISEDNTDSSGNYSVQVSAGSYVLFFDTWNAGNYIEEWYNDKSDFDNADPVTVTAGQITTLDDAVLAEGAIINGQVTDSPENGIVNVYVKVYDLNYYYLRGGYTDSSGNYTIQGLPAGNCKVFFSAYNAGNYVDEWYNDKGSFDDADPVSITTGQTTVVDAVLSEGGMIGGRVTDSLGNGIQDVYIEVNDLNYDYLRGGYTDSNGDYTIQGLPGGNCKVYFNTYDAGNYLDEWYNDKGSFDDADPISVTTGQTTVVDAGLAEGGMIGGWVTDSQGSGIADVYIEVRSLSNSYLSYGYTDLNGDYNVQRLPAGDCKVYFDTWDAGNYIPEWYNDKGSFDDADPVSVTAGQTTVVDAVLVEGGMISGRVTDSQGSGIADVYIEVRDLNNNYLGYGYTDSNGDYLAQRLPAGDCKVYFDAYSAGNYISEWYNNKDSFENADVVSVTTGQTTNLADAVLAEGGMISGRVTDGANGIENVTVRIYDLNNNYIGNWWTDNNGDYTAQRLLPGNYKVHFDAWDAGNYISEWYNDKGSLEEADPVTVIAGQTTIVDAVLTEGGMISGRVTDSQGNGIENVYIEIDDLNGYYLSGGYTDSNGDYTIQGLPTGNCKVYFGTWDAGNYIPEWYNDKNSFDDADPVSVTTGQTTVVDAILIQGGLISGRVTDSQGNGIADVYVYVSDLNGYYLSGDYTDSNGDFLLQRIPGGNCKVFFDAYSVGNYISEWYNDKDSFENADAVLVTPGQTTTLDDAVLAEGGIISGRVTDGSNGIEDVRIRVYDLNYSSVGSSVYTDSNGDYTIQNIPGGNYKVRFYSTGNYIGEWYNDKGSFEDADVVPVSSGQTTTLDDAVLAESGSISGHVTDTSGNSLTSVWVNVYDLNYDYLNGANTNSSGNYTVSGIPAGNYKVEFDTSFNYVGEWYDNKGSFSDADLVTVTEGQDTPGIDAQLPVGGIISGQVTDETSGNPIGSIWVEVYDLNYDYIDSVSTNSSGDYTVNGMPTGNYKVQFYDTSVNYIGEWYENKSSFYNADPVPVTEGQETPGINAQLTQSGMISGRVKDSQGNGIADIYVYAYDLDYDYLQSGYTDSNGEYTVYSIPPGNCKVYFDTYDAGNYISEWYNDKGSFDDADHVSVISGQTTTLADAVLAEGGMIGGRVTDSQGNGIADVYVEANDMNNDHLNYAYTDSNGDYTVQGLPAGSCKVYFGTHNAGNYLSEWYNDKGSFDDADIVSITAGQTTNLADAVLDLGGGISGRVTDGTNGIYDIVIEIYDLNNNYISNWWTDSNGDYTVQSLPVGSYKVYFDTWYAGNYHPEWYNDKGSFDDADIVSVTSGQTTTLADAVLAEGGLISGRVTDGTNGIYDVRIRLYDLDYNSFGGSIYTNSNGDYTIQGLPNGNYKVRFYNTGNFIGEWYNDKGSFDDADMVSVTAGQTTTLADVVLTEGGSISGRVTNSQGNGIANVYISAFDMNYNYVSNGYTNSNGDYTVPGIPAGEVKLFFNTYGTGNYVRTWYDNKRTFYEADPVSITVGQTTTVNVQLANGGRISGTVTDGTNGIAEIAVSVYDLDNNYLNGEYTDSSGAYTVQGLPGENCKVYFDTYNVNNYYGGNYIPEWYDDKGSFNEADQVTVTVGQTTSGIDAVLAEGGSISGRVTDGTNGIEDVYIRLYDLNYDSVSSIYTDSNGDYNFSYLAPGTYKVRFYSTGNYIGEWYNDKGDFYTADEIVVASGQTTSGIDAVLVEGGGICGQVSDGTNGIENVYITLYDLNYNYVSYAYSDNNGDYCFTAVAPGSYKVEFNATGSYFGEWYNDKSDFYTADEVVVMSGQTTPGVDAVLAEGGTISGRVTDSQGNGLEGVYVYAYDLNYSSLGSGYTDSNGYYTTSTLPGGNCKVYFRGYNAGNYLSEWYNDKESFETADQVSVTAGETTALPDVVLAEGGSISGRVTDANGRGGIEDVYVQAYDMNNSFISRAYTDSNGDYTLQAIPTGNCKVRFYTYGNYIGEWYSDKNDFDHADPVLVTAGQTTANIHAALETGGSITGNVTDSSGKPISNLDINIYDPNGNYLAYGYTDQDGNYEVDAIPRGSCKVLFDPWFLNNYPQYFGEQNYAYEWYNDMESFNEAEIIHVSASQVIPGIDAVLSEGGTITGAITDGTGNGIKDISVLVLKDNTQNILYYSIGYSHSDGVYEVKGLRTGNYLVIFRAGQGYTGEFYNDVLLESDATLVPVTIGSETSEINAVLTKAGTVTGRVTDAYGNGIARVSVRLYDSVTNEYLAWLGNSDLTDNNGYYTIFNASPGDRKVMFDTSEVNSGAFVYEFYNDKQDINSADVITVQSEETLADINAVLSSGGGTLSGYVTDTRGIGLAGVSVEIYDTQYHSYRGFASTDSSGYFEVKGLVPGEYKVLISLYNIYPTEWYNDQPGFEDADAVTVTEGESTSIRVILGGGEPAPSLNILSPNGGETLTVGSRYEITWDGTEEGTVTIECSTNGGRSWTAITKSTPNDGSYDWTVPNEPSENCLIRVSSGDSDEGVSDISDTVFSIVLPTPSTITVTSPNGGESLTVGSIYNITWTSSGNIENVTIEYSTDSGNSWQPVVPVTVNSGSYSWTVPDTPAEDCLIRIIGNDEDGGPLDISDAEFSIVSPSSAVITVISPNGSEQLQVGTIYNITWTTLGPGEVSNVKIECSFDSGNTWTEIIDSTTNNGSYPWTVIDSVSDSCLIRISDVEGNAADVSDAVFSIVPPPTLTLTSPNGGESWEVGSTQTITWTSTGTIKYVTIEYSVDSGNSWAMIEGSTVNNGSFDWKVPDTPSGECLVRISGNDSDSGPSDVSDGVFSILSAPVITVIAPNGGESFIVGTTHEINWTSSGAVGNITIEYSTDNGNTWITIVSCTANDGSYSWLVPGDPSDDCLVRISECDTGEPSDISDRVFSIMPDAAITVTSPNGGENLTVNSQHLITWTSTGMTEEEGETVIIEYSTDNGGSWTTIAPSAGNTGEYQWTVPDTPADNCLIRVSGSDGDAGPSDVSDSIFSIVPIPEITVTSPNGGEQLTVGAAHEITWTFSGASELEYIILEYSTDNGASWRNIDPAAANSGSYSWTIPDDPSENCLVRVRGGDADDDPADVSDSVFSIVPDIGLTVTAPNGGEQLKTGSTYNIAWEATGISGDVNIDLYRGESFDCNIGKVSAETGRYEWKIPENFSVGDDYRVLIFKDTTEDYSDASFSITEQEPNHPDFNNDGKVDILWRNYENGLNEVWYMDGAKFLGSMMLPVQPEMAWRIVGTGDFNRDGKIDILWRSYMDGRNMVWYMNGTTLTGQEPLLTRSDTNWQIAGTGDFNRDGSVDVLWRNTVNGENQVWYLKGVSKIGEGNLPLLEDQSWRIVGTGDFNGDGKVDLLWRNYETGKNEVWTMDGVLLIGSLALVQLPGTDWQIVGTGDFNCDGATDILWRSYTDGKNMIWTMDGAARTGYEYIVTRPDLNWRVTGNGDYYQKEESQNSNSGRN